MAFRDTINMLAASASEKATAALESGKLNLRINQEEKKIADYTERMGQRLLAQLDDGKTCDSDFTALYEDILKSRTAIEATRTELSEVESKQMSRCDACGDTLEKGAKFCKVCGAKLD